MAAAMNRQSVLTNDEYAEFCPFLYPFLQAYIPREVHQASERAPLADCIRAAYRDFCRTLHGIRSVASKDELYQEAANKIEDAFVELGEDGSETTYQAEFDAWHKGLCEQLIALYVQHGFHLHIGQAQKWINMTFKYVFVLNHAHSHPLDRVHRLCHAPLDNRLVARLVEYGFPGLTTRWSRIDNYVDYLEYQRCIRRTFSLAPLDAEFRLWLGKSVDLATP